MLKHLLLSLISVCVFTPLFGQLEYGVKLSYGIGMTDQQIVRYDDADDYVLYNINLESQKLSPSIAVLAMYSDKNANVFLQGELEFRVITNEYFIKSDDLADLREFTENKRSAYLQIPITGGLEYNNFRAGAGFLIAGVVGENEVFTDLENFSESRSKIETAAIAMIAFNNGIIDIGFRYEYFFSGAAEYVLYNDFKRGFTVHPQFITASVGMMF